MTDAKLVALIEKAKAMPWSDREFYATFMAQIFFLTKYSVKLLSCAAAFTDRPEYQKHLMLSMKQEVGHDKLAASDLKAMGLDTSGFREFGVTRTFWESQLYKTTHSPDALIGYIYCLERAAVEVYPHSLPIVVEAHGAAAAKFMRLHAEEDQEHVVDAWKQIEALGEKSRREAMINVEQSCEMLSHLFDEVLAEVATARAHKKAA